MPNVDEMFKRIDRSLKIGKVTNLFNSDYTQMI